MALDALTGSVRVSEGHYLATIPDQWQQGRGAFGGLVLAIMLRAVEQEDVGHPLRTVDAQILAPVLPGEVTIAVERLRAGSGTSSYIARLVQAGEVKAFAMFLFGKKRMSELDWTETAPPVMPPWRDVPVVEIAPPMGPVFAQHFWFRPTGPYPFTGGASAVAAGWILEKERSTRRDAAFVVAHADVWWPAAFSRLPTPRPIATVSFFLQMMNDAEGLDRESPMYLRSFAPHSRDGYFAETRELYGEDGRLLALNQQTFVFIK